MTNLNNKNDFSYSLIIGRVTKDEEVIVDKGVTAFYEDEAKVITSKKKGTKMHSFKLLKMGDSQSIPKNQSMSCLSIKTGDNDRDLLWKT